MADLPLFLWDAHLAPTADHAHERLHQHQTFLRHLVHKQPNPKLIPNYPDVDIRDNINHYLVEVEVPGVKDVDKVKCQWTSSTTLVVSGENSRPGETAGAEGVETSKDDVNSKGTWSPGDSAPYTIIGERKIGAFRRFLSFPSNVDSEKTISKLEAGVLCLKIAKKTEHIPKGGGTVKIEVESS